MRALPLSVPPDLVNVIVGTVIPGFSVIRPTSSHVFAPADWNTVVVAGRPVAAALAHRRHDVRRATASAQWVT